MKRARRSGSRSRIMTVTTPPIPRRSIGWKICGLVAFRYCGPGGEMRRPKISTARRARLPVFFNETHTVLGLMPHPENATDPLLAATDGRAFFDGLVGALAIKHAAGRQDFSLLAPPEFPPLLRPAGGEGDWSWLRVFDCGAP